MIGIARPNGGTAALEHDQTDAYKAIRRGWRFGSEEYVERILDQIDEDSGENQTRPNGRKA